jgi:hypothetical protein
VVYIESSVFTCGFTSWPERQPWRCSTASRPTCLKNPARGDLVQGLGGIRKARCSNPARGKGKRGGYRYLFLYLQNQDRIHLLYLLDKDEQEDLSNDERRVLRTLVTRIKESNDSASKHQKTE